MSKTILQGTVKGARRIGRQKNRWEDNIKESDGKGVWRFPEGSKRQGRVERYCCNVICGAKTTSDVKGLRWNEIGICFLLHNSTIQIFSYRKPLIYILPIHFYCIDLWPWPSKPLEKFATTIFETYRSAQEKKVFFCVSPQNTPCAK